MMLTWPLSGAIQAKPRRKERSTELILSLSINPETQQRSLREHLLVFPVTRRCMCLWYNLCSTNPPFLQLNHCFSPPLSTTPSWKTTLAIHFHSMSIVTYINISLYTYISPSISISIYLLSFGIIYTLSPFLFLTPNPPLYTHPSILSISSSF